MKKALYLLLVAALFVGCNRDKKKDEPTGPFIFFETRVGESGNLPQREGEAFGVFGYHSSEESLSNVFTGYDDRIAQVAWDAEAGAFAYEKLVKWSGGTYSFYAYYPYAYKNQVRLTVVDNVRYKTLQFVQPCELDEMVDLMTASAELVAKTPEPVRLQFESKLFAVDVVIANYDEMSTSVPGLTIVDAEIDFTGVPQSMEFDIDGTGSNISPETVDINADLYAGSEGFELTPGKEYSFTKEMGNSFYLIPDAGIKYSLAIEYIDEEGERDIYTYPEDGDWASLDDFVKAGGRYAILIDTSSGTPYPFKATLVADWEDKVDIDNDFN
ncbi:MAG: fimbrillin family protein [Bacteroidales bacterium]|jgi:hypothetical protein|nr:fimbrillin family protein [Bacteroidales bacterium]